MSTVTVISAHSGNTMDLVNDTRYDVVIAHIKDRDGKTIGLHDAPREAFLEGVEQLKNLDTNPEGEILPEGTAAALRDYWPTPPLTVADLSAKHIGKKVRVTNREDAHTGYVDDLGFDIERQVQGGVAQGVRVEFDNAIITFPLTATVEVL